MWWYVGDWDSGAWLAVTAGMLAFWGVVLGAILAQVRDSAGDGERREVTPKQILAERFARGGIDEEGYGRRLATLRDPDAADLVGTGDPS